MVRFCVFMCSVVCRFSVTVWVSCAMSLRSTESHLVVWLWRCHKHLRSWCHTSSICILLLDDSILALTHLWRWEMAGQLMFIIGAPFLAHDGTQATASILRHFNVVAGALNIRWLTWAYLVVIRAVFLVAIPHTVTNFTLVAVKVVSAVAVVLWHYCCATITKVGASILPLGAKTAVDWWQLQTVFFTRCDNWCAMLGHIVIGAVVSDLIATVFIVTCWLVLNSHLRLNCGWSHSSAFTDSRVGWSNFITFLDRG